MQARKSWNNVIQMLEKNNGSTKIVYLTKLSKGRAVFIRIKLDSKE